MINSLQKTLLTVLFLLFTFAAFGQTNPMPGDDGKTSLDDDKSSDPTSSFKFGINYLSDNVFMGRSDTAKIPTFAPEVKYTFKNGIFFSGSLYIIPSKAKNKLDGGNLSGGYNFDITDDLSGSVSYTKLFYSQTSTEIASNVSSTFNANLSYDIADIITPSLTADYSLNKQGVTNDFFLTLDISHDFIVSGVFGSDDLLLISPTVTANTGTENFYDAYLIKVKKIRNKKLSAKQTAALDQYTDQLGQFSLLDEEVSVPIEYKLGYFIFQFTPTYAIVKNQLPKEIETRLADQPSVFYYEIGIFLKF